MLSLNTADTYECEGGLIFTLEALPLRLQNAAAYLLFNRRQMEGHAVPHVQDCSLSQSIADEVRQKRPHYQPEGSSHSEVGRGEVGEGQQEEETLP